MPMQKASKDYKIKTYECDKHGNLRLITLLNIFQDVADTHASDLGLGLEYCHQKGLAWVGANYHLIIDEFPKMHQKIIVHSWPAVEKKLGAYREFLVTDENGKRIIRASSQWILINFEKKRPVSLRENLPQYQVIPERMIETEFPKINDLEQVDYKTEFKIRFDDIDINNHVNNAVYLLWATEAISPEFRELHQPQEVEITFKKEAFLGETIEIETQFQGADTTHVIKSQQDGRELAKIKILWQNI